MKIAIAADHAGFVLKEALRRKLAADGHEVLDFGTDSEQSCDYPDFAQVVGREVAGGHFDRGVLVCGTGIGMSITANKIPGIRAAHAASEEDARLARQHNDANILALGGRSLDPQRAAAMVDTFLNTEFLGGRHARRLAKIAQLEKSTE